MTLWTEQLGPSSNVRDKNVSEIIFREKVHSKIRRFIVVRQHDRFCTCLQITSYDSRNKKATNLGDHGIIHSQNIFPSIDGISRPPVRVHATKDTTFRDVSLINYARTYTIETNLKVFDVGELDQDSKTTLYANFSDVLMAPDESLGHTRLSFVAGVPDQNVSEQRTDQNRLGQQAIIALPQPGTFNFLEVPQIPSTSPSTARQYTSAVVEDFGPSTSRFEGAGQLDSSM